MKNKIMIESEKILCKNCKKQISSEDKICPHCKADLSKVGRHFEVTLTESLKLSDEVLKEVKLKWDPASLASLGIFITIFLALIPLCNIFIETFWCSVLISFLLTIIILIAVTKIKYLSYIVIKILRWLIK